MKYIMLVITALVSYNTYAEEKLITPTNQHFVCESIKGDVYKSNAPLFVNAAHAKRTNDQLGVYLYSSKDHVYTMSIGDEVENGFYYGYMMNVNTGGKFEIKCSKL